MSDSEKFSNNSPELQDALRSIGAIGEDSGATAGDGPDAAESNINTESSINDDSVTPETTDSDR